jgi:hypothetical protein
MPWKKLPACTTGQINESLRQKLEFEPQESSSFQLPDITRSNGGPLVVAT